MSLVISKVFTYDTDAGNYIQAVEAADGQALEAGTRQAINNFVVGCKQDGIWSAIKASCILSGARTTNGALVPLVGTAPTPFNFDLVGNTDYNRKTGLKGNGTTKYLNANRNNNADPQNSFHLSAFSTEFATSAAGQFPVYVGSSGGVGERNIYRDQNNGNTNAAANALTPISASVGNAVGFFGNTRSVASTQFFRANATAFSFSSTSVATLSLSHGVFAAPGANLSVTYSNARLAFYSIGESLDLALLDARVTALITAFGVAIP
jgi:hypothetical protein